MHTSHLFDHLPMRPRVHTLRATSSQRPPAAATTTTLESTEIAVPNTPSKWSARNSCVGGFISLFFSFGALTSFGVFQTYYETTFISAHSESAISWIGSVQATFVLAASVLSGPSLDCFGIKPLMVVYTVSFSATCALISFCTQWSQLFGLQGVLLGLALSIGYAPPLICALAWYEDASPAAVAFVSCGTPVGGIALSFLTRALLESKGFAWTWRILALIAFPLLGLATCLIDEPPWMKRRRRDTPVERRLAPRKLVYIDLLKHGKYLTLTFTFICVELGWYYLIFFIGSWLLTKGGTTDSAFYAQAVVNAGSLAGRLILCPAPVLFREPFGVLAFTCLGALIVVSCCPAVTNASGVFAIGAVYGFFSGGTIGLIATCTNALTPDKGRLGASMGQLSLATALPALLSGPMYGQLIGMAAKETDVPTGNHFYAQITSGSLYLAACILAAILSLLHRNGSESLRMARNLEFARA